MTMAEIFEEKAQKFAEVAMANNMVHAGSVANFNPNGEPRYLYVEAGGPQFLRIKWVDSRLWVHTEGNGGFGCSWCCCGDTPIYAKIERCLSSIEK